MNYFPQNLFNSPQEVSVTKLDVPLKNIEILECNDKKLYKENFTKAFVNDQILTYCDEDQNETDLYGYSFILKNLISEDHYIKFVQISRKLSFENPKILKFIQDYFLVDSLRSIGKEYMIDPEKSSKKMVYLNDQIDKENEKYTLQPPNVWGYVDNKPNDLFFSMNPFEKFTNLAYLKDFLDEMSSEIQNHNQPLWENFVDRNIEFFQLSNSFDLGGDEFGV